MTTRSVLPQNYVRKTGTLFEDFETLGDWSLQSGTGTVEVDTEHFITGTKSLKITETGAAGVVVGYQKTISQNFRNWDRYLTADVYIPHDPYLYVQNVYIRIASTTNYSKTMYGNWSYTVLKKGWNRLTLHPADWLVTGSDSFENDMVRLCVRLLPSASAGGPVSISIDNLKLGERTVPKVAFTFDDIHKNSYDNGCVYMMNRGLKGTYYSTMNEPDQANRMTTAELTTAYNAGWAISNHTTDHTSLSTLSTAAEIISKIQPMTDWLIAHGFTRSAQHLAFPSGEYNDLVLDTCAGLGLKTVRSTTHEYNRAPFYDGFLSEKPLDSTVSLATAMSQIDYAIKYGCTVIFLAHEIDTVAGTGKWATADFQALVDYAIARKIDIVSIDELYEGQFNPRYRSLIAA